jgi:hypothetical protein
MNVSISELQPVPFLQYFDEWSLAFGSGADSMQFSVNARRVRTSRRVYAAYRRCTFQTVDNMG